MKILYIILLVVGFSSALFSQTKKINNLEGQRKLILKEITTTTQLLNNTQKSTATILDRINLLSQQINSRNQVILLLNQEVTVISQEESKIQAEIIELQSSLKKEQDAYAKAVRGIASNKQQKNKFLFVLSGKSFSESMRRLQFLKDYSQWRKNQAEVIKNKQVQLQEKQTFLSKTKTEKIGLLADRNKEQAQLKSEEQTHQKEIEEANGKQKELQALLAEKQRKANNLNSQIQKLIAEEVARQEREAKRLAEEQERKARKLAEEQERKRKAAELAAKSKESNSKEQTRVESPTPPKTTSTANTPNSTESSTKTYVTRENVQLSSNFAANKGRLPKPITGNATIVGRFGVHQHNRWKVSTNNNGIDLRSQPGAQATAVSDGEVSRVVAFPGFNNCVIIRHGSYYTFYGNIQQVAVKQGQKVSTNQTIGTVYVDTDTNSSTLHFQLWQGTTKLNPEPWIRK